MAFSLSQLWRRKRSIENIGLDELNLARVKLEQEQARVIRRIDGLEKEKEELFGRGVDETSERKRRILAGKIRELDQQARNYDKNLTSYSKQTRIINGFIFLKENRKAWADTELGRIMQGMDLSELQNYVDEATAGDIFQMDKFGQVLGVLEESEGLTRVPEEDTDIQDIMAAMEAAREAGAVDVGLERLQEVLRPEELEEDLL